jgi:hypothetical protein
MKKALAWTALVAAMATTAMAGAFDAWPTKTIVTINTSGTGAATSTTLTNYPLLLRITDSTIINKAKAGGADIRFSSVDEATEYSYEIEQWYNGPTTDTAIIWVRIPSIPANTAATRLKIHVGNAAAPAASNGANVFRTADGFLAVYHMNQAIAASGDSIVNSTGGRKAAAVQNNSSFPFPVVNTGIGQGYDLAGTGTNGADGRWFTVADADSLFNLSQGGNKAFTLSGWANVNTCAQAAGSRSAIISKYQGVSPPPGGRGFALQIAGGAANWTMAIDPPQFNGGSAPFEFISASACSPGVWQQVTGTFDGTTPYINDAAGATQTTNVYVNGVVGTSSAPTGPAAADPGTTSPFLIGAATAGRVVHGYIDEARVSNVLRSADWAKLDYETQRSDANITVTYGTTTNILPSGKTQVMSHPVSTRVAGNGVVFTVAENSAGVLKVLDVQGRTVWSRDVSANREVTWNAAGKGVYFARFLPKDGKVSYLDTKFSVVK